MTLEKHLIQKTFFEQTYMTDETREPVQVLGELFYSEQKKDLADLSNIRLAQGEIYYHYQDYEAAIYKWEHIHNELEPWARKNMADAYVELDLEDTAEGIYRSISTDSKALQAEIALQLFGIYLNEKRYKEADETIKTAVKANPEYPNVTTVALAFFEEQQDWDSAIELLNDEAIRTKSLIWFEKLLDYIEKGYTQDYGPAHFIPTLTQLVDKDQFLFEKMTLSLWEIHENEPSFLTWLHEMNELTIHHAPSRTKSWSTLSSLYENAYLKLVGGKYRLSQVSEMIPRLLEAWMLVADSSKAFRPATAVQAWNDLFPKAIPESLLEKAQDISNRTEGDLHVLEEAIVLFQSLKSWANTQQIDLSSFISDHQITELTQMDENNDSLVENTNALLTLTKDSIQYILDHQSKAELTMEDDILRDEDLFAKVNGSIHQLKDIEEEKVQSIKEGYQSIKEEIEADLLLTIPKLIKESTEIMKEDSDFRKMHLDLNTEMNNRINSYLKSTVLPIYGNSLRDWIKFSKEELVKSQVILNEWSDGFNDILGEELINLQADFQILADWQRDADRMTSSIQIENENILLRRTPTQVLLKGAGKIFGALPRNNAVLAKSYKNFIENESYHETSASISSKFFRQFELLENSISRDIHIFFKHPFVVLNGIVEELEGKIAEMKQHLDELKTNPEAFRDPLTFAEVKLRQCEWMNKIKQNQTVK